MSFSSSNPLKVLLSVLTLACVALLSANGAGVGNLVYLDGNGNGFYDAGEGIDGVTVQLYLSTDTPEVDSPQAVTATADGGQFLFNGLAAGNYFLHVPSAMFGASAVMEGLQSMTGVSIGLDDDAGEDGEDALSPATTGVRTSAFSLADGTEPTDGDFETGGFNTTDNAEDSNVDLTVDFGFVPVVLASFSAWQTANPLGGSNQPTDNPDGDEFDNLMEYALAEEPGSAVAGNNGFEVIHTDAGVVEARFTRAWGGHADLTYVIEGTTDEPGSSAVWTELTSTTPVTQLSAGEETVVYSGLQSELTFLGATGGFLRLRVDLDADFNFVPEETSYSPVWAFATVTAEARNQTFGMPLATKPAFSGTVDAVNSNVLDLTSAVGNGSVAGVLESGKPYYVEVISGDLTGHRWEVNEAAVTATSVTVEPSSGFSSMGSVPLTLAGATVVVRPYWQIDDLFSGQGFAGATSQVSAAKLTFYDAAAGQFFTYWRFSNGTITRWLLDGDATLSDAGTEPLDVCAGMFMNPGSSPATLRLAGVVRTTPVACGVTSGANLITMPSTVAKSPLDFLMTVDGGFIGSTSQQAADRLQFWLGDNAATEGYEGYYLYKSPSLERWLKDGDANLTDYTNVTLFPPFRAFFVVSSNGLIDWKMAPLPVPNGGDKESSPR